VGVRACGREFGAAVIGQIAAMVEAEPALTRQQLSRRVAELLGWRSANGRLQEVSCRVALLKLHRHGMLPLPHPQRKVGFDPAATKWPEDLEPVSITTSLQELPELELVLIGGRRSKSALIWRALVSRHHYLGYRPLVGAQLRYLIRCRHGWLGALGFSAAAWRLAARDQWIGWNDSARRTHLHLVVCNSRFAIQQGVQVPNLASWALGQCARRLPQDWERRYGYTPVLLETYVEQGRFLGTCYRAANWVGVGSTSGRGRQDREHRSDLAVKDIYLYRLREDARALLAEQPPETEAPAPPTPPADWAEQEFGAADLKDRRLRKRLLMLARDFYAQPLANLPEACGSLARTKAAYRFFAHQRVTMTEVLQSHYQATAARIGKQAVVLAVQDTTTLNYSTRPAMENLGPIGTSPDGSLGLWVHDTMAYTVEGTPLGLLDVQCWARDAEQFGKRALRYQLPIEAKESHRWLVSFRAVAAAQRQHPDTMLVSVGDREADIYELFLLAQNDPAHPKLLVRADRDRLLVDRQQHLWESLARQEPAGLQEVRVPRRGNRPARVAQLELRFAQVELQPPKRKPQLAPIRLWAIMATERDPEAGASPIRWLLLTTVEVTDLESAVEKLRWYALRWQIEVFHRTLKSGCRIEDRQLRDADRLEACLAIDMVVAWRIVHLTKLGRETPEVPCTVYFGEFEWKALVGFINHNPIPPPKPPSLREAIRLVARLGGFLGRKGDGEPGTETLWRGLQRLDDIAEAWQMFSQWFLPSGPVSSYHHYG